jgi:DivIVA domain-containing protein
MPLTPEDVQKKQFSTVRFKEGYDEEEVDAFLDEVEAELRRLLGENQSLSRTASAAPAAAAPVAPAAPPPPAEDPNETALRTLLLAQRTADEAIAQAKAEAEQVVAQARVRAGSIESQAQQQHAAAMAELQRQRETFERQIDNLRTFEREYRTRLKAYLEGQLRDLESRTAEPPAGTLPPATTAPPASVVPPVPPVPPAPTLSGVPPVAGTAAAPPRVAPAVPASPFTPAPPLVEDMDSGSDAPVGPPREADDDSDVEPGSEDT